MASVCLYNGTIITGYAVLDNSSVLIEDGIIKEIFPDKRFLQSQLNPKPEVVDLQGAYAAPGFIDTHIHGYGGIGVCDAKYPEPKSESEVVELMIELSKSLVKHGLTAFNPTVYPATPQLMLDAIPKIVSAMGKEDGAKIMGLHMEGPFLSPSRLGVQRPEGRSPVDMNYMEKLWAVSKGSIVNMTVAPEIENMHELALYCRKKGIVLQAGHTEAGYEDMLKGMQTGIFHATHLFNAMSKLDQRNPNAVGAILTHSEMSCEIIADGFHFHPNLFKLLLQNKAPDKIVLVTDSLKCTDQQAEPFFANGEEMVFVDGLFKRKADSVIAGSAITMIRGVQNMVKYGFSLENAVKAASTNPAAVMRYTKKGTIAPGKDADITVFDNNFTVLATMIEGKIRYNNL